MWMYVLVFVAALAVDSIPVFAPPAWTVLVVLLLLFHLNPWLVVIVGVTGSTLGRYILSIYVPKVSSAFLYAWTGLLFLRSAGCVSISKSCAEPHVRRLMSTLHWTMLR